MVFVPSQVVRPSYAAASNVVQAIQNDEGETLAQAFPVGDKAFVTGFFLDRWEVTNRQFERYVASAGVAPPASWAGPQPSAGGSDHPVRVTRAQAEAYSRWVGAELPSLLQMVAASSNGAGVFPWQPATSQIAVSFDGSQTSRVGGRVSDVTFWGLADMVGNVLEWTTTRMRSAPGGYGTTRDWLTVAFGQMVPSRDAEPETWNQVWAFRGDEATFGFRCAKGPLFSTGPICDASRESLPEDAPEVEFRDLSATSVEVTLSGGQRFPLEQGAVRRARVLQGEYTVAAFPPKNSRVRSFGVYTESLNNGHAYVWRIEGDETQHIQFE